ncbi:hypothetical protein CPB84DRAFT_1811945 [Gymnopilus junonius]|uniref:Uncharacterized protein n=1 Tax=Gymnopilus junonius TaxID=109634 RepID=A0A9P5P0E3_GYMJU|nr:hypothetical protein CPB84DRAFT_1811945 [Gymnopilus junonius]
MQFKNMGGITHLSGPFQLMWNRISFSRLTTIYFFFSVAHFIVQLSLQIRAFTINADAAHFLTNIVDQANTTNSSLPFLHGSVLRMCSWVPSNLNVDVASCPIVWNGSATSNGNDLGIAMDLSGARNTHAHTNIFIRCSSIAASSSSPSSSAVAKTSITTTHVRQTQTVTVFVVPQPTSGLDGGVARGNLPANDKDVNGDDDGAGFLGSVQNATTQVTLIGLEGPGQSVVLNNDCLWSLNWPVSMLGNTKREDMVFIGFQVWVLGMSIVALLNESIPHILASLLTHVLATAWAAFQIFHTASFHSDFNRVITHGACNLNGVSLLPNYWEARSKAEIPGLVLNIVALLVSCLLTWKLIKLFGWQTFKRVGASLTINRIYKLVLFLSITIQLSLFFMIVTVSLWVDQLMNSVIGDLASFQKLYKVTSFITLAGWFAVRRELRVPMVIFLLLSVLYLGGWGVMFFSTTFRWTFTTWTFFSIMASASVSLTLLAVILGVLCRLNFGKGLARYLNAQQPLGDEEFTPGYHGSDFEKVSFPNSEKPLPTYTSFDEDEKVFPPSFYSGSTLGPRFANKSAEPFETTGGLVYPAALLTRNLHDLPIHRSDSYGSTRSRGSDDSQFSHARTDSSHSYGYHKRWVIE